MEKRGCRVTLDPHFTAQCGTSCALQPCQSRSKHYTRQVRPNVTRQEVGLQMVLPIWLNLGVQCCYCNHQLMWRLWRSEVVDIGQTNLLQEKSFGLVAKELKVPHHCMLFYFSGRSSVLMRLCKELPRTLQSIVSELQLHSEEWTDVHLLVHSALNNTSPPQHGNVATIRGFEDTEPSSSIYFSFVPQQQSRWLFIRHFSTAFSLPKNYYSLLQPYTWPYSVLFNPLASLQVTQHRVTGFSISPRATLCLLLATTLPLVRSCNSVGSARAASPIRLQSTFTMGGICVSVLPRMFVVVYTSPATTFFWKEGGYAACSIAWEGNAGTACNALENYGRMVDSSGSRARTFRVRGFVGAAWQCSRGYTTVGEQIIDAQEHTSGVGFEGSTCSRHWKGEYN